MTKTIALLAALATLAVAGAAPAGTGEQPIRFKQKVVKGFYRDRVVQYFDLGPVKLARGNKVAPIWAFTNGASGQRNVVDTVPGRRDYTPLWDVRMVTWAGDAERRVLRSAAAIRAAQAAGEVAIRRAGVVVNCPIF